MRCLFPPFTFAPVFPLAGALLAGVDFLVFADLAAAVDFPAVAAFVGFVFFFGGMVMFPFCW